MEELAAKWEDLTDIQQASITELIAGKRQGNIVASLMTNFDVAQDALKTSRGSEGSAMAEHEKWMQSLEAKILQLKAAWQSLSQAFMSSDFLKGALNIIIDLIGGLTKLIDTIGVIPTLLIGFEAFKGFTGKGFFKIIEDEAALSGKKITNIFKSSLSGVAQNLNSMSVKTNAGFKNSLANDVKALSDYRNAIKNNVSATEAYNTCLSQASKSAQTYAQDGRLAKEGIAQFTKEQKIAQVSTVAQNKTFASASAIMREYNSGCKNTALSQKDFVSAVNNGNPAMGKYLTGLSGAKASMRGYVASLVGAKAASIGLTIATTAMNAALTMGISYLVTVGINQIMKVVNAKKELAEKVEEVTSKYKEQHQELKKLKNDYDTSDEDSMISRYKELSKGVDSLGENVSLTADEYAEYQGIVSTIAGQIPSLVTGYNSQGDAILSCAGNVNELAEAYRNLIIEQDKAVIKTGEDIFKNFKDNVNSISEMEGISATRHLDELNEVLKSFKEVENGKDNYSNLEDWASELAPVDVGKITELLEDNGFERNVLFKGEKGYETQKEFIIRAIKEDSDAVKEALGDAFDDINAYAEELNVFSSAYLDKEFLTNYSHMSEKMQGTISQVASSFNSDFYEQFSNIDELENYLDSMLSAFDNLGIGEAARFEAAFDLQTQFNGGEISYGEYVKGIQDAEKVIDSLALDDEVKNQIKLALNTEEVTKNYDALKERLTERYELEVETEEAQKKAEKFLNGLSASEYAVAVDLIANEEINFDDFGDIESLRKYIEEQAKLNEAMNFTIAMDVETESIEALNTAMAESVSGAGLSSEAIAALKSRYAELEAQGYDLSAMFEETSNGIHLNREAVGEFEQALASDKLSETNGHLETLKGRYDELTDKINNCTDAGERASLYSEQQQVAQKINDLATLASQYEGLTSAYKAWQDAESSGNERDMYENVISGFGTMDDEISRGWIDDSSIAFLELLTGKTNLAAASTEELKEAYDGLDDKINSAGYSVRDFFTVDDEGNSTNTGVYNFLETVEAQYKGVEGVIKKKDGEITGFDFNVVGGDEAIAEALGISEELVQIMVRAADDAGFVVTLDGNYTQLADLKTSAEEANAELKKLGKTDIDFNFGANNLEDLNTELGKSMEVLEQFRNKDGTINMKMEGAEDALEIASYFTATIDKLTEPAYMQLETNQVEEELRDPLTKMQEFERLSKEKHQLKLTGDKKGLKEVNAEMDEIAEFLEGLDEETKIDLDIDGLSQKEIKSKLEKGEIEIPATVDIQMEMSDDIKDMRLLMMNELGLVSDNEVKLKIGYEIDDSLVDRLTDEEKEVVIKYIEENEDVWDKYSQEEREAVVKIIADGTDIDSWEAEEKKALVKYVADGGAVDNWTPEEKQAFAKYLVDGGNVDGWTPEAKDAFVKYLVDGGDPDKFDPEDKESWVVYKKDSKESDNYQPPKKDQTVTAQLNSSEVDGYNPPPKTLTVKAVLKKTWSSIKQALGIGGVNGTVNADGTTASITTFAQGTTGRAFKQGSWSTKDSGTALMGELGRETIVRDGRFFTVGDTGAGFYQYKKGDIIFNHKQTEELFRNGKVTSGGGRGRMFATGTAFSSGTGSGWGKVGGNSVTIKTNDVSVTSKTATTTSKSSTTSSGSTKTKSYKNKVTKTNYKTDKFQETFDWIEIKISRLERAIDRLDQKASRTWKSWSYRNTNLKDEISKINSEITTLEKASNKYLAAANNVKYKSGKKYIKLDEKWKKKVRNGTIDFSTINNESLAEAIKEYQEYYEKYLEMNDKLLDAQDERMSKYSELFDNVITEFEGDIARIEHRMSMMDEFITQQEAKGHIVSSSYYKTLIDLERQNISKLNDERDALIQKRDDWVKAGGKVGSEEWDRMTQDINGVTLAITEGETAILEYNNAIRDIEWEIFDLIQERISNTTEEAEFLIDLMSRKDLFDDNGKLTDEGLATMGLYAQNYNTHMEEANNYDAEIANLNMQIAEDPYNQDLINRRDELVKLKQESITAAYDEMDAIKDLVEEGIEVELDALQERIDKYEESLDAAKDLYDYNKKVKNQTKEIANLEKQLAAYQGDDSEEAKAKVQQIKLELEEARDELEETEYDKYIENQEALLDDLYTEYEEILNARLDDVDVLLEGIIAEVNASSDKIAQTIEAIAGAVGYDISDAMDTIWNNKNEDKDVVSTYSSGETNNDTTTNDAIDAVERAIEKAQSVAKKEAEQAKKAESITNRENTVYTKPTSGQAGVRKGVNAAAATVAATAVSYPYGKASSTSGEIGEGAAGLQVKAIQYALNKLGFENSGTQSVDGIFGTGTKKAVKAFQAKMGIADDGIVGKDTRAKFKAKGYKTGVKSIDDYELAWTQEKGKEYIVRPSDGAILTPLAKGDSVLNAAASSNIWEMANDPAEFIKNNLDLNVGTVPNNVNVQSVYNQNLENVVFNMPNVRNYNEMLSEMQRDKNFEKLVLSMSIDRIAGGTSLAKGKAIR